MHKIINMDSRNMSTIKDKSVNLIVTSPPYPMIDMWDNMFFSQNNEIEFDFAKKKYLKAYEKMHNILNDTWRECDRVLGDNGFICINIGDATRTFDETFQLFSNHSKIIDFFFNLGYSVLPDILWRKQSNSPNKFMGSGMYPAGAYVTYEHEYILIFRKGGKRIFKNNDKLNRQKSAYFWEERNIWFSDLWDIKGTSQFINKKIDSRERNASFPFEIPYRLVNMFSVKGDTVLDPFCGFGTTNLACIASERNSIGFEIDKQIATEAQNKVKNISINTINSFIENRLQSHYAFIKSLPEDKVEKCYTNVNHNFLVKTRQETNLEIKKLGDKILEKDFVAFTYI